MEQRVLKNPLDSVLISQISNMFDVDVKIYEKTTPKSSAYDHFRMLYPQYICLKIRDSSSIKKKIYTCITLRYITLHYITLHSITLHYITLHHVTLHYTTLHYITSRYITLHYTTLNWITLHHITLRENIHYITLH